MLEAFSRLPHPARERPRETKKSGWNKSEPLFCITDVAHRC